MLALEDIGIEFGGRWLVRQVNYQFLPGERIGLIGRNGAGKSTLLKLIAGELSPSAGTVHRSGSLEVAYFHQDLLSYQTHRPIIEVAREAFADLLALKREIETLLQQLEQGEDNPERWDELAVKQATFEAKGGTRIEASVHSVLAGLGFASEEHEQPYHTFSGGWRMRVLLAKMLLMEPDLLLLDEPTNHLDLPSIEWLESYLKTFRGTVILVSHDRLFIDRMAQKMLEISLGQLHIYGGNYAYYLKEKALRMEQQQKAYENQQKYIAQQEAFINRFRYKASKARQAQSKIKQLEKLEKIAPPMEEHTKLSIRFPMPVRSGKAVLTLSQIEKRYGDKVILTQSDAQVWRGQKIALIGANGLGKSTLLRIMADVEPFQGIRQLGHQVIPTFFAQHQLESLDLSRNVLEEVSAFARGKTEQELRTLLGCFMFSGEDVEKKIQVLSGGERSRVALVKTLLAEANFLLLDEPTNHLDIQSIQILVEALQAYAGSFVVVSHDRFFLQEIANEIWYIEDQKIRQFQGSFEEYEAWQVRQQQEIEASQESKAAEEVTPTQEEQKPDYQAQKQRKNRIRKLQREQSALEEQSAEAEQELARLEASLQDPDLVSDYTRLTELQTQISQQQSQIDQLTETWGKVVMELEALEASS